MGLKVLAVELVFFWQKHWNIGLNSISVICYSLCTYFTTKTSGYLVVFYCMAGFFLLVRSLNYFLCEWFLSLRDSVFFDLISTHQVLNLRFLLLSWFFFGRNIGI